MDVVLFGVLFASTLFFFVIGKAFENRLLLLAGAVLLILFGFGTMNTGISYTQLANSTVSQNVTYGFMNGTANNTQVSLLANQTTTESRSYAYTTTRLLQDFEVSLGILFMLIGMGVMLMLGMKIWDDLRAGRGLEGW